MKISNLIQFIKQYLVLEKISWILVISSVIANLILWYLRFNITQYNIIILYYSTGVLILNVVLSLIFSQKSVLVEYLFLSTAFLVQVFALILLYHTIY